MSPRATGDGRTTMPETTGPCNRRVAPTTYANDASPYADAGSRAPRPEDRPDALARAALGRACRQSRPGRPPAADLPQGDRRVRGERPDHRIPRGDRELLVR